MKVHCSGFYLCMTAGCAVVDHLPRAPLYKAELVLVLAKMHKPGVALNNKSLGDKEAQLPIPNHSHLVPFLNHLNDKQVRLRGAARSISGASSTL